MPYFEPFGFSRISPGDFQPFNARQIEINYDHWDTFNTPLVAVCYFSIFHLLHEWWDLANSESISLDNLYHGGRNMLAVSAAAGYLDIVNNIMQRGMPVNAEDKVDSMFGSPLTTCSAYGHQKIVRLLLEHKAGVNIELSTEHHVGLPCYGSALSASAWAGNLEICQILLEAGADANLLIPSGDYGSALAAAAWAGNLEICRLLLDVGVDVNLLLQAGEYGGALVAATVVASVDTCQLLLEDGAD
jgi:ankyrin repeat domain-containing protein 50